MTKPSTEKTLSPLDQFRKGLKSNVNIETKTDNQESKVIKDFRTSLERLNKLPELNESALASATAEQKVSVESMKVEYFRLTLDDLNLKLQEVLKSHINNKQERIDALRELIKENVVTLEKVGGNNNKEAKEISGLRTAFNKLFRRN